MPNPEAAKQAKRQAALQSWLQAKGFDAKPHAQNLTNAAGQQESTKWREQLAHDKAEAVAAMLQQSRKEVLQSIEGILKHHEERLVACLGRTVKHPWHAQASLAFRPFAKGYSHSVAPLLPSGDTALEVEPVASGLVPLSDGFETSRTNGDALETSRTSWSTALPSPKEPTMKLSDFAESNCLKEADTDGKTSVVSPRQKHADAEDRLSTFRSGCALASAGRADTLTERAFAKPDVGSFQENLRAAGSKGKVRMHSISSEYKLNESTGFMYKVRAWVFSDNFLALVFLIIASNLLLLGVETDFRAKSIREPVGSALSILQCIQIFYTVIFTMELGLRLFAEGCHFFVSSYRIWNWFDTLIVILSLLDATVSVLEISRGEFKRETNWLVKTIIALRPLRVLRVVRLASFIRQIRVLVSAILQTLQCLVWALLLMFFVVYSFAMLFTDSAAEYLRDLSHDPCSNSAGESDPDSQEALLCTYWASLPRAMQSLFQMVTGGIDWNDALQPLASVSWILVVAFFIFFVFMTFIMLNVMTAVFCQTAIEAAEREDSSACDHLIAHREQLSEEMRLLLEDIDTDRSGTIDGQEIDKANKSPKVRAFFHAWGIQMHEAWALFKLLDCEGRGCVDVQSFVDGLLLYRGPARAVQIAKVVHDSKELRLAVQHLSASLEHGLRKLGAHRSRS